MAIRKWKHRLQGQTLLIRADSVVALATGPLPDRLVGVPLRQFPKEKVMQSALKPPGTDASLRWGQTSKVVSASFEEL